MSNILFNNINIKKNDFIFLIIIFFLLLFLRIGYWNFFLIDSSADEITYLLAGREIINGKIPYVDFWEIKTIYAFIPYTIANIFENPIFSVRVLSFLSIYISILILFFGSKKIIGIFVTKILVILFVLINSQEQYQTSHLTSFLYPLLFYLYFLIIKKPNTKVYFFIGFIVSLIVLVRLNFYPICFGVLILILLDKEKQKINKIIYYTLGGVFPVLIFIIIYLFVENGLTILYESLLLNLIASGGYVDLIWNLREIIRYLFGNYLGSFLLITLILPLLIKNFLNDYKILASYILLLATLLSVINVFTGIYQFSNFFPYLLIVFGYLINILHKKIEINEIFEKKKFKNISNLIVIFFLLPITINSAVLNLKNYVLPKKNEEGIFKYDSKNFNKDKNLVSELKKMIDEDDTFFTYDHYLYILLNKKIISNLIHPTLFSRLHIYKNIINVENTAEEELNKIIEKRPKWIVLRSNIVKYYSPYNENFINKIKENWDLVKIIEGEKVQFIYKSKQ